MEHQQVYRLRFMAMQHLSSKWEVEVNRKSSSRVLLAIVALFIVPILCVAAFAKRWDDYDRLHAIERFLGAIYPELQQGGGFITLQSEEFNVKSGINQASGTLSLFFVQCWPGSGVPGGGEKPLHPHCNGFIGSVGSDFLHIILETGPAKFPIRRFYAQGKFVDEKQSALLAEVKAHPEWKEREKLEALRRTGAAKFGPENKEAFLKSVPADVIYQFSGCRLNLRNTTFGVDSGWVIQGMHRWHKKDDPCHANFEPFEGKLVNIDQL